MSEKKIIRSLHLRWQDPITNEVMQDSFALPITIGRDTANSIVLGTTTVSRNHAEIILDDERVILRDLGSSNGSYVNGQKVTEAELADQSIVTFGDVEVTIAFSEDRPRRPSRDYLFSALADGEAEPTISLSSLDQKSLFADVNKSDEAGQSTPDKFETTEKLSGEELKQFLSGRLQKNMEEDIAPDIHQVASSYSGQREARHAQRVNSSAPPTENDTTHTTTSTTSQPSGPLGRFMASLRRLLGR